MKRLIKVLVFTVLLFSCNTTDKKNTINKSSNMEIATDSMANEVTKILKAIDTDEALVATALMAAPKESRSGCKVIGYNMAGEFVTFKDGDNEFICLGMTQNGMDLMLPVITKILNLLWLEEEH